MHLILIFSSELTYIRDLMGNLAAKGLIKSLLAADDISLQIDDGHRRLSDCLACFQVAAHIDAAKFMAEAENARASDERQLRTLLGQLMAQRNRDAQVLKELQLGQEDLIETMLAVKKVCVFIPQVMIVYSSNYDYVSISLTMLTKGIQQLARFYQSEWSRYKGSQVDKLQLKCQTG